MSAPGEVDVWIGLDVGKEDHFVDVLDDNGDSLFARSVANDEGDLIAVIERASEHGTPGLGSTNRGRSRSSPSLSRTDVRCRSRTCPGS